jgi:MFS family permease
MAQSIVRFSVVLPLIAGFVLHTGAAGFGLLSSFVGIGALGAAVTTAFSRTVTLRRLIAASLVFGVLLAASALVPEITVAGVVLVALGFAGVTFATSANTLLQLSAPDALRGRVMGIYTLLFIGSTPIGALLIGGLSSIASVPTTLVICGALCVLGVTAAVGYHWRMH